MAIMSHKKYEEISLTMHSWVSDQVPLLINLIKEILWPPRTMVGAGAKGYHTGTQVSEHGKIFICKETFQGNSTSQISEDKFQGSVSWWIGS